MQIGTAHVGLIGFDLVTHRVGHSELFAQVVASTKRLNLAHRRQGHCKGHSAFCHDCIIWHARDGNAKPGSRWHDDRWVASKPSGVVQHLPVPSPWHRQLRVFLHCRAVRTRPLLVERLDLPPWCRMASAVLWCVKTLPKEASMGRTQSVLDHGSLPASRLQHHERNIVSPDDVLPASQRPEKRHEVSRRHLWVLGARSDVGDRLDVADGVCLRLRVVVRICCLYGPLAAGSSHKRTEADVHCNCSQGASLERQAKGPLCRQCALPGVPLPPGLLVVRCAIAGPRAIDQPPSGHGHRLSTNPGCRHCNGFDDWHGTLAAWRLSETSDSPASLCALA